MQYRVRSVGLSFILCIGVSPAFAQPLGTGFTYQGELRSGGVPASGVHDLRFRLYDAASGGAQVGPGTGAFVWATAPSGTTYGVYGRSDSSTSTAYGVWAQGRLGASGTKSFRIDHPEDPEHRYLLHYAAESPEVINFYRGTVMLDERGEAVVQMPAYFARINRDPSYHLTAVGAPMPMLHVAEEIDAGALEAGALAGPNEPAPRCWFRIAGGMPGGKVSWEVKAVRHDLWVRRYGAPVEVEKEEVERGRYQHPELYDQPRERGMIPAAEELQHNVVRAVPPEDTP